MEGLNWVLKESFVCTGLNALNVKINEWMGLNKNTFVVSKIKQDIPSEDSYTIELWYNVDSMCHVINAFTTDYL